MDVSQGLVNKYHTFDQVRDMSLQPKHRSLTQHSSDIGLPAMSTSHWNMCLLLLQPLSFSKCQDVISRIFTSILSNSQRTLSMGLPITGKCSRQDTSSRVMVISSTGRWKEDDSWCHFSKKAFTKPLFCSTILHRNKSL